MRQVTRTLLCEHMPRWPWFCHVGTVFTAENIKRIDSWNHAIEQCSGRIWEIATLQVRNSFFREISQLDWYRFNDWNNIVVDVRSLIAPLIERFVLPVSTKHSLPKVFVDQVRWDVTGIAMETEFADIRPPNFNINVLAPWYERGHFPCGWDGPELPDGWNGEFPPFKLFVY